MEGSLVYVGHEGCGHPAAYSKEIDAGVHCGIHQQSQMRITRLHEWAAVCSDELVEGGVYPLTFEILFQFLSGSLSASAVAHARRNRSKSAAKPFKGTAPLALVRDLTVASKLFRLGISAEVLKDDKILPHFAVVRSLETQAEQAVLGFRSWRGLELMAAALAEDRLPPAYAKFTYPSVPVPAPELDGWNDDHRWDCDAAQTVVVSILASLRTVELLRSKIINIWTQANTQILK